MMRLVLATIALLIAASGAMAQSPSRAVYLTEEEIKATIAMLDECVKAKGLACAEAALVIRQKLLAQPAQELKK